MHFLNENPSTRMCRVGGGCSLPPWVEEPWSTPHHSRVRGEEGIWCKGGRVSEGLYLQPAELWNYPKGRNFPPLCAFFFYFGIFENFSLKMPMDFFFGRSRQARTIGPKLRARLTICHEDSRATVLVGPPPSCLLDGTPPQPLCWSWGSRTLYQRPADPPPGVPQAMPCTGHPPGPPARDAGAAEAGGPGERGGDRRDGAPGAARALPKAGACRRALTIAVSEVPVGLE